MSAGFIFLMQISVYQNLPRIIYTFDQDLYYKSMIGSCIYLSTVICSMLLQQKLYQGQNDLNGVAEFHLQINMICIIVNNWLAFHKNRISTLEKFDEFSKANSELMKTVEENDVHGASLVHELRNPLNSMMGSITLLEKILVIKNQQINEILSMAKCCGEHLHTLIGNILEFSKLKKKKIELNKGQVNLKQNVRKIVKMNYFKAKEKNIALNLYISYNFPRKIIADEQRINQILINLISNSIKFTDKGAVNVYLGWKPIIHSKQDLDSENNANATQSLMYLEEKYLFKNFGDNQSDESGENPSSYDTLSKLESYGKLEGNRQKISDGGEGGLLLIGEQNGKFLFESQNDILLSVRRHKRKESKKQLFEIEDPSKATNSANPEHLQKLIEINNFKNLQFANTVTFLYDKGGNATFQQEGNPNEVADILDNQEDQRDKDYVDLDDFLLNNQQEDIPPSKIFKMEEEKKQQEQKNDIDYYNMWIQQEETISAREQNDLDIKDSFWQKEFVNQEIGCERQNVNYSTPPIKKERNLISDKERRVVDVVVSRHKKAAKSFLINHDGFHHTISDEFSLKEDISNRNENLISRKMILDQQNKFQAKFMTANDAQSQKGQRKNEEKKAVMKKRSFSQISIDDHEILKKAINNARKHSVYHPQKKDSFDKQVTFSLPNKESFTESLQHLSEQKKKEITIEDFSRNGVEDFIKNGEQTFKNQERNATKTSNYTYNHQVNLSFSFNQLANKQDTLGNIPELALTFNKNSLDVMNSKRKFSSPYKTMAQQQILTPSLGPQEGSVTQKKVFTEFFANYQENQKIEDTGQQQIIQKVPSTLNTIEDSNNDTLGKDGSNTGQSSNFSPNQRRIKSKQNLKIQIGELDKDDQKVEVKNPILQETSTREIQMFQGIGKQQSSQKLNENEEVEKQTTSQSNNQSLQKKDLKEQGRKLMIDIKKKDNDSRSSSRAKERRVPISSNSSQTVPTRQQDQLSKSDMTENIPLSKIQSALNQLEHCQTNIATITQMSSMQMNLKRYNTVGMNNEMLVINTQPVLPVINDNSSISINNYSERGILEMRVVDTGIGISEEGLQKLFQPYIQADKTIQKNYGGTGLGLCICHELAQIMEGNIEVKSKLGAGSEFIVNIPLEISAEVTGFVDDFEFERELSEIDLNNYEFCICNYQSYGIQQIKKQFLKKQSNVYVKEAHEINKIGSKNGNNDLFKLKQTYKAFIVDYQSVRGSNLLQILSNYVDTIKVEQQPDSPEISPINNNQEQKEFNIKVPVIVLIQPLLDESRVKKSDNIFVLRVPFDAKSMKKILIFLKRYYQNFILSKQQKNSIPYLHATTSKPSTIVTPAQELTHNFTLGMNLNNSSFLNSSSRNIGIQDRIYSQQTQQFNLVAETLYNPNKHMVQRSSSNFVTEVMMPKSWIQAQKQKITEQSQIKDLSNRTHYGKNTKPHKYNHLYGGGAVDEYFRQRSGQDSKRSNRNKQSDRSHYKKKTSPANTLDKTYTTIDQTCLVVNDDQFSLKITSMLLDVSKQEQGKNFNIITAVNGQEALEIYKKNNNIKLILMDIEMPLMDGYEATKKIREYEEHVNTGQFMAFIIGVSGNSTQEHFRKCIQVGMNEAVLIPITTTKINELVSKVFS